MEPAGRARGPGGLVTREGGCLCGRIRYRVTADPVYPHLCSCSHCQSWSGAPAVGWVDFALSGFEWTGDAEPTWYHTYPDSKRGHCVVCGSSLCALDDDADSICVTLGSLDPGSDVAPEGHSFESEAPSWWFPENAQDKD